MFAYSARTQTRLSAALENERRSKAKAKQAKHVCVRTNFVHYCMLVLLLFSLVVRMTQETTHSKTAITVLFPLLLLFATNRPIHINKALNDLCTMYVQLMYTLPDFIFLFHSCNESRFYQDAANQSELMHPGLEEGVNRHKRPHLFLSFFPLLSTNQNNARFPSCWREIIVCSAHSPVPPCSRRAMWSEVSKDPELSTSTPSFCSDGEGGFRMKRRSPDRSLAPSLPSPPRSPSPPAVELEGLNRMLDSTRSA